MSPVKTYLFTDKETGELVFKKKSRNYNYGFDLPEVDVSVVAESTMSISKAPQFQLIKKKLEVLVFLRTMECMMIEQIEKSLSASSSNPRHQDLIAEEKRLALTRVQKFFAEKHSGVASCQTVEAVSHFVKDISDRVNLGVYSAMNQERKNLDSQEDDDLCARK